ncbi:ABC transporter substrate-binding protein [Desulfurivibrio dismutans]|uniref:ABC transporter substrate-binding protein n=1 Tax=Desulfurivibrio dismutans TaxID=1398908 RepID=UPI0023DCB9DF|nr:ABC transporter substrate-binding protein [Desulfurivibrio alkaliphilus]MDF1615101.1 ABC transporter substrate-binding protein [Desulfurivibrio alkaliphilus]
MSSALLRNLTIVSVFLLLLGGGPATTSYAGNETRTLKIADGRGDWGYPNPFLHYPRGVGYIRMSWVFDTLVWKDESGFIPALAQEWSYDPEHLAFTFKLNPKARWHDGEPLTAADVVFTVAYFQKHPYHWVMLDHVKEAKAIDRHTVTIFLTRPYAPFISNIGGIMPILPRHIWQEVSDPRNFNEPSAFIGSGPYVFKNFDQARGSYLYEAFADYYQGRPTAERLIYLRAGQPLVALTGGQADLANIRPEMAAQLRQRGFEIISDQRGWNKKLMINHRRAPFNERKFRQALAHAIDRREIIDRAHRGFGAPASYGLLSVDHPMYNPDTPDYPTDQAKARQLLEHLGYRADAQGYYHRDGRPLKVELLASTITAAGETAADRDGEVIRRQLNAVGIRVELVNLEQATTDSRVRNWQFDLALSGHGGIGGDPLILVEMISGEVGAGSVNSARFDDNPELARLLREQMTAMDPDERRRLVHRIQELHALEVPAIPLYYPDSLAAYQPAKGVRWFFTPGGIGKGVPIPQNKVSLLP